MLANELEFAEAVELGERALEIARRAGDELAVSRAMDSLKFAALQLGDVERLEELCAELERAQRKRGEEWYLQFTLCESCYVPAERCDWGEAERRIAEAMAISERTGDPGSGVLIRDTFSWIARCRGDYARSLAFGREAVIRADTPGADWLGWAAAGLATPLLDLGAAEEAVAALQRGLAAAERNRARGQIFRCLGALSSATRLAGGEPRRAPSLSVRNGSQSRSPRRPGKSTSGASRHTSRSPRPTSRPATSRAPREACEPGSMRGSVAGRGGRSQ